MVVTSLLFEATAVAAGIEEREAAGAVGRFQHAGREAGLADQGGLLIAGDAADRDRRRRKVRGRSRRNRRRSRAPRQKGCGHAEQRQQLVVPAPRVDVEQQRARGVGGVGGVHVAAGEPPQQISCRSCRTRARPRRPGRATPGTLSSSQASLVPEKYGSSRRPVLAANTLLMAVRLQPRAQVGGAPVLPDDGAVDRLAGGAVPQSVVSR